MKIPEDYEVSRSYGIVVQKALSLSKTMLLAQPLQEDQNHTQSTF